MKDPLRCAAAAFALALASPALAQDGHEHRAPAAAPPEASSAEPVEWQSGAEVVTEHAGHDPAVGHSAMTAALGAYPMGREASGTAWQPDVSPHTGLHITSGDWTLMGHLLLNGVYDWQEGPRGDEKAFVSGMVMGMARRDFADGGALQLRAMLSPDPFMGKRGLPILLGSGETADGANTLIDRQHPHDLFMELSASYSRRLGEKGSAFVYLGVPGEPAFGPPAFMHRLSIMDSPEPPITHHWLDSTHITFGVVTLGFVHDGWKLEASRFTGREPDQHRYNFDKPRFDSTAARVSWNPAPELSLQASWAHARSVEQLEPDQDQTKWSASAIYTRRLGGSGYWSTTLAWGRRSADHAQLDAWILETAVKPNADWTVFARAERTETNELLAVGGHHGPVFNVAKVSVGAIRDFHVAPHATVGVGALYAFNLIPQALEPSYGGDANGAMAFVRLKID